MMDELETALLTPPPADRALDDKTADLHKAFHIFVKGLLEVEQVKLQKVYIISPVFKTNQVYCVL